MTFKSKVGPYLLLVAISAVFLFSGFYYRENLPDMDFAGISSQLAPASCAEILNHYTDQSGLAPDSCDFEDYSPIYLVSPPMEQGYCKQETDVCPSIFISLDRVWSEINKFASDKMSHFIMNIGANDGKSADPLFPLLEQMPEISGLYVEIVVDLVEKLEANMQPYANIEIVKVGIHPGNAVDLLKREQHKAKGIDIFKIDIDSCECHILDVLMQDKYFQNIKASPHQAVNAIGDPTGIKSLHSASACIQGYVYGEQTRTRF
jgi:hypothetical protein